LLLDADEFRPKAEALGTQRLTANAKTKTKKAGPPRFADDNQKNNGKDKTGGMDREKFYSGFLGCHFLRTGGGVSGGEAGSAGDVDGSVATAGDRFCSVETVDLGCHFLRSGAAGAEVWISSDMVAAGWAVSIS
jgi:hypothetical protein